MGLFSGIGGAIAGNTEAEGYKKAGELYSRYGSDANFMQNRVDPFWNNRNYLADRLFGIVTGTIDFETDPGYKFRMDESLKEVGAQASARGFNRSGNVMAALQQRSQDVASQEYSNIIQRLSYLAGATPEASIAGGQAYQDARETAMTGQAASRIGQSQSSAAGTQAAFTGFDDFFSSFFGGGAGASAMSDERLKKDLIKVAEFDNISLYTWTWNEEAEKLGLTGTSIGVVAQEVQKTHPEVVSTNKENGYLQVDYSKLGLEIL